MTSTTSPTTPPATYRHLTRSTSDKKLGGVAGGLAAHFSIDPLLVRIGFVVTTLISGVGAIAYIALAALLPTDTGEPALISPREPKRTAAAAA